MQNTHSHSLRHPPLASPLARVCLVVYLLVIGYASLYPLTGWHDAMSDPLSFINFRMPRYWTGFDLATNVLAYMPLGCFLVFALYPRWQKLAAVLLAVLAGGLLSATMECIQNYLPTRVPSSLDLLTNTTGCLLGALFGVWQTRAFLDHGYLHLMRKRWFSSEASRGLLALGLWPMAQLYPQTFLFGHGQAMPLISERLSELVGMPIDLHQLMFYGGEISIYQFWLAEVVITASGLCGAVLSMMWMLRSTAPRWRLVLYLIATTLVAKSLASALAFAPEQAFLWLTPGAQGGLVIGAFLLFGFSFAPNAAQRRLAALMLLVSLVVVNLVPENPYFNANLQAWTQGKFLNFNGAAQMLALLWPVLAIWSVWHPDQHFHAKAAPVR